MDQVHIDEVARALALKIIDEANTKRIFHEAMNEWLDKKFSEFNRDTMKLVMVALFGALISFVMWSQGYHK